MNQLAIAATALALSGFVLGIGHLLLEDYLWPAARFLWRRVREAHRAPRRREW